MPIVKFIFNETITSINCNSNDKMKEICQRFCEQINKDINSLIFIYGNTQIQEELSFLEQSNIQDKDKNKKYIYVQNKNINDKNNIKENNNEITLIYKIQDNSDEEEEEWEEDKEDKKNQINILGDQFVEKK